MWTHLELKTATLENLYKPLYAKAKEYDRAWSIAELRLSEGDVRWLRSWFGRLTSENMDKWIKSAMLTKFDDEAFVSKRQMFGALLISVAAEVCREESTEDSVWPAIRSTLPSSHAVRSELFLLNGQPSILTKDIITDAVRALNLRHAMDIEGTQQWFTTIKLQFGFTYRGAKKRLAEWLVNLGRPHTVQYLNGDFDFPELASTSFQSLWRALTQYRRGLIKESEICTTLEHNPWIKPHWIDDLLKEARARIAILGIEESQTKDTEVFDEEASSEELCPVKDIALEWPNGQPPRFTIHLDRQTIEDEIRNIDISELNFYVDGRKLCRWCRQKNGSWTGPEVIFAEPDVFKQQPNLDPMTLVLKSAAGEPLVEWDFADSGLSKEVLVFDLDGKRIVRTGAERLEPNRQYAIVCDRKCEIQGCDPVETFDRSNIRRKVIRLPSPLDENLRVAYEDFVLWQPVRKEGDLCPRFPLVLSTPPTEVLSLNAQSKLFLTGLPENAESVKLLIHAKTYELDQNGEGWRTLKDIKITPELAGRRRRVRVRFSSGNKAYNLEPRLAFALLGAAKFHHEQDKDATMSFEVLKQGDRLNRSEETTSLRIWTPSLEKRTEVLEGDYQVGQLRHQKIRLNRFPGYGGLLYIVSEGERRGLGATCIDMGCVRSFYPPMLGRDAQMVLHSDKNPAEGGENGYVLYAWFEGETHMARFQKVSIASIQTTSTSRLWKIRDLNDPMAVALTWKGSWLGAWWNCDHIRDYINRRIDLPEHDFAILKWLRVPVWDAALFPTLKKAVLHAPCRFIKTWLYDSNLPDGIKPHPHIPELDSVVRSFLWNDFPIAHSKDAMVLVAHLDGRATQENCEICHLTRLSEISTVLLWKGMENYHKDCPKTIIPLIETFVREQLGLQLAADEQLIRNRIQGLEKRVIRGTGIEEERLKETVWNRIRRLHERQWYPLEQDCADLLRLGQTLSGRMYLSALMGWRWLDWNRR